MTIAEKTPHMVQWWREAHDAIIQECITEGDLTKMVHENPIEFRAGLKQTLSLCDSLSIPFLVFSAGLADLIEEIIRQQKLYLPSMHVISNRMIFDEESGRVVAFSEPIVHVFNKNEFTGLLAGMVNKEDPHLHASKESLDTPQLTAKDSKLHDKRLAEYKAMISNRRNVLLLGDSVGDIQMGQGVSHDQLLSVGFLNMYRQTDGGEWVDSEQHLGTPTPPAVIKKHVDAHLDTFDVVLSNDCSLETFINELLESIMIK